MTKCTCRAPVNIAVVKYWGKRDENLILPINSSLSVTLHIEDMCSTTTVEAVSLAEGDSMTLNAKPTPLNDRTKKCLATLRSIASSSESKLAVKIVSSNNFPTAAGLASSASGYACLVAAVAKLWRIELTPEELSVFARQGSGSACRSLMGGFVAWDMGTAADGSDSRARQVAPLTHWPDMCIVIAVASADKKHTPSTEGMQLSVETSELLLLRAEHTVPRHMAEMERAIQAKDFAAFATLTMKESNQFHATCLDTLPPIHYLTPTSYFVIRLVHAINTACGDIRVAYTFDAGPNAVLFVLKPHRPLLLACLRAVFAETQPHLVADQSALHNIHNSSDSEAKANQEIVSKVVAECGTAPTGVALAQLIDTKIGPGPHFDSELQ
eukprot:c4695_g1_i1.p1 GENE.c4695_g1_i1~~c4695_g1_i1.p1  ORF type:complete len:390 (-),score=102.76 c4695_g1_i1:267-1415(-)